MIKIKLTGFEKMLEDLRKAGGDVDTAARKAVTESATIFENELKQQMKNDHSSKVESDRISKLADRMPKFEVNKVGNAYIAHVGFESPRILATEINDGAKFAFLNYGTPKRSRAGTVAARNYIANAKKAARQKMKKTQTEIIETALKKSIG